MEQFIWSPVLDPSGKNQLLTKLPRQRHSNNSAYANVNFAQIDVDAVPDVAGDLGIRAMPTFMLFKDGEKVDELLGANPPGLEKLVQQSL